MKPPKPPPEDEALFRRAMGGVTPIRDNGRVTPAPAAGKPVRLDLAAMAAAPYEDAACSAVDGAVLEEYLANGVSRLTLRKLRRGNYPVQDRLDLHGLDSGGALKLLQEFLQQTLQRQLRCVLVVHGKGLHSQGGEGVLKSRARHWLSRRIEVMAYCDAPPALGGSGAVLLLLKLPTVALARSF